MTTISPNRRRSTSPLLPLIIGVTVVVCVLGVIFFRTNVANVVWHVLQPSIFLSGKTGGVFGGIVAQFSSKAFLYAENNRLRDALATSTIQATDRDLLFKENQELRLLLNQPARETNRILADVVLRPPGTPYDTLIITAGKKDGIRVGNLVSPGGTLVVGTVAEVYDTTSRVILFSAPGSTHAGLLDGTIPVTVRGQGGGSLVAEVPVGQKVTEGGVVTFPSLGTRFSARVVATEVKEGASFTTVYMSLPVHLFSLQFVEVLTNTAIYEEQE